MVDMLKDTKPLNIILTLRYVKLAFMSLIVELVFNRT